LMERLLLLMRQRRLGQLLNQLVRVLLMGRMLLLLLMLLLLQLLLLEVLGLLLLTVLLLLQLLLAQVLLMLLLLLLRGVRRLLLVRLLQMMARMRLEAALGPRATNGSRSKALAGIAVAKVATTAGLLLLLLVCLRHYAVDA
jgi:hypothetical protein